MNVNIVFENIRTSLNLMLNVQTKCPKQVSETWIIARKCSNVVHYVLALIYKKLKINV